MNDQVKVIIAVVFLAIAGVVIVMQTGLLGGGSSGGSSANSNNANVTPSEPEIINDEDGGTVDMGSTSIVPMEQ